MGLSASSVNPYGFSSNYSYNQYQAPFANTSAIAQGAYKVASADPLAPSTTSYGVNANPQLTDTYIPSSAYLTQNSAVSSNVVTTTNVLETGNQLQSASSQIAQQTPGSKFATSQGVFSTNQNVQPQTSFASSNINSFTNIQTQSQIVELTGRNAQISGQTAANIASVNANLNIQYSQQTNQALIALQNAATASAIGKGVSVTARMDGMIPIAAATLSDFSAQTSSTAANVRVFDNITETFNRMMDGGGHGGGGFMPQTEEEANDDRRKQRSPFEFNQKKPRDNDGLNFMA